MTIQYLIGVDGGGSGTRARVVRAGGPAVGFAEAGPSGLSQGVEQAWHHVRVAIERAFAAAGLASAPAAACALGLGLAGANVSERRAAFVASAPPYAALVLDTDAGASLAGAHRGEPGAVVLAGTGSVGEALHADGRRVSAGGWGFPVGDEGSGAWLGLRAVAEAQRALDGRTAAGALAHAVWAACGAERDALLAWCERAGQRAYAQLAPLLFETEAADPAAAALLARAAGALEAMVRALDPAGELPLVVGGSIGRRLAPRLPAELQRRAVEPAGDAADGALLLVRRSIA